ncbi:hypothetical protein BpHYR1_019840 [Brachionus plicatilis]|uniref:Uncharacterized protein n=1 Tax=Brachionus plicatilis TaxID=10195 RepID=A0A3M7QKA3_BRAPC|nr:hypothetical protein BpHYR1_019840 [Brachionus plicatilis]
MLRNQEDHDHGFIRSSERMRKEIKDKIIHLFYIKNAKGNFRKMMTFELSTFFLVCKREKSFRSTHDENLITLIKSE